MEVQEGEKIVLVVDGIISPAGGIPEPYELSKKCFRLCKFAFYTYAFLTLIFAFILSVSVIAFSGSSHQRGCSSAAPNSGLYFSTYTFSVLALWYGVGT